MRAVGEAATPYKPRSSALSTARWIAPSAGTRVISTVLQAPCTEQRLRKNPLGIYVKGLSWIRELDSSKKPSHE